MIVTKGTDMLERSGEAHPRRCDIVKVLIGALWRIWDPPENAAPGVGDREDGGDSWQILGFTLIEVLMIIVLLAALAGIALPNYRAYLEKAQLTTVLSDMKDIEKDVLLFAYQNNAYPASLADINRQNMRDPWGNPFQYLNITTAKGKGDMRKNHFMVPINDDFDLYSMGPDGKSTSPLTAKSSRDDIVRADNGTFFGKVEDYY